jgi:hypothetical protein
MDRRTSFRRETRMYREVGQAEQASTIDLCHVPFRYAERR